MTTITKYVCDLCGQVFDNEIECQRHEILEKIGKYSNDVIFFGRNKKVISFDDVISLPAGVWGIYIEDESAIPLIDEIFDLYGVISHGVVTAVAIEKLQDFIFMMTNIIVGIFLLIKLKN